MRAHGSNMAAYRAMRALLLGACPAFFAGVAPASAGLEAKHFDVAISTAPTHDMALGNGVYSPTGSKAVLNVNDLTNALAAGNLEVTTGNGAGGTTAGNLDVNTAFHWASGNTLILDAYRAVRVNQPVTDAGTGPLTIATHDGSGNGRLEFSHAGNIVFWGLSNPLSIDGKAYTLVNSVASLAAAIASVPDGNYALAASYDAAVDKIYAQSPIATVFEGNFDGLGNAISNVSTHGAGFFTDIDWGASVSNLRLRNVKVREIESERNFAEGGLAGQSNGSLYGDDVSGAVAGIYATNGVGGLIGFGSGRIVRCASTASVQSHRFGGQYIGGLVGQFSGTITNSSSTADIKAGELNQSAGGLAGMFYGVMRHSHATGNVKGVRLSGIIGGLIGEASGKIYDSYATGNVATRADGVYAGGLVGEGNASISGSFSTGRVDAGFQSYGAGGLVGGSTVSITNSYATGTVGRPGSGWTAGGLIGDPYGETGTISGSYATGKVSGEYAGGFAGNPCNCFSSDYWDTTTSETTDGIPNGNAPGITGLTTAQLKASLPAGFDPHVWAMDRKINHGFPYLIANPPPQ